MGVSSNFRRGRYTLSDACLESFTRELNFLTCQLGMKVVISTSGRCCVKELNTCRENPFSEFGNQMKTDDKDGAPNGSVIPEKAGWRAWL